MVLGEHHWNCCDSSRLRIWVHLRGESTHRLSRWLRDGWSGGLDPPVLGLRLHRPLADPSIRGTIDVHWRAGADVEVRTSFLLDRRARDSDSSTASTCCHPISGCATVSRHGCGLDDAGRRRCYFASAPPMVAWRRDSSRLL